MLEIIGIGSAFPENRLNNDLLLELGVSADVVARSGIISRSSVLPTEYLLNTRNVKPEKTLSVVEETPTVLAMAAVSRALEDAALEPFDIGMILGDTASQLEMIPGEAQRVGRELGIKVPAFDLATSSSAFPFYFKTISQWKEDLCPRYILCVSVHTPTRFIDYSYPGLEAVYLGDAASAVIVSTHRKGKFGVRKADFNIDLSLNEVCTLPVYGHLTCDIPVMFGHGDHQTKLYKEKFGEVCTKEIVPPLLQNEGADPMIESHGFSFGAFPGVVLDSMKESLMPGESVFMSSLDAGLSVGAAVLHTN